MCCALFPQQSTISVKSLEPELKSSIETRKLSSQHLYYNKGL
uniref:Uncharacterized protein n=1 Tax=Romanomermis culicivorax TaxID=13658 RepID=A0A915I4B5_ROMCU